MSREMTMDMVDAFTQKVVTPVLMAEMEFDSQTIGMWTGYGSLTWGMKEFLGGGNLIGISSIDETQEMYAKGIVASLNGIPSSLISVSLSENTRGRPFRLYLASVSSTFRVNTEDGGTVLTEDGGSVLLENNLVNSPYRIFSGLMDVLEFVDNGETASIRVAVENILIIGQRQKIGRYTHEEQRKRFSNDKGLEFINQLQDKEVVW